MSQNKARKTLFDQYVLLFTVEERPAEAVRPLRPQRYNIFSEYANNCTKNRKKSMFFAENGVYKHKKCSKPKLRAWGKAKTCGGVLFMLLHQQGIHPPSGINLLRDRANHGRVGKYKTNPMH
jgi:hypothetical protein